MEARMDIQLNLSAFTDERRFVPLDPAALYDVLIVGGGPAAMTAAVYCMRKGVSTGLVTERFGGQIAETSSVENYLGFTYIEGLQLVERFTDQVKQFPIAVIEGSRARALAVDGPVKRVTLENGATLQARAIVITTGKHWRRLGVPGEAELTGRGVAYCSTCDAPLFAGKSVAVVGGGNSGVESAIDLARIAERVTLVQFLDALTADRVLVDALAGFANVEILFHHEVTRINGTGAVQSIAVRDNATGAERDLPVSGIFIEIGLSPNSNFARGALELNEQGEIAVDCACRTSAPGVFAAGDVTTVPFKQIIIAAGEGAKAALSACEYVLTQS